MTARARKSPGGCISVEMQVHPSRWQLVVVPAQCVALRKYPVGVSLATLLSQPVNSRGTRIPSDVQQSNENHGATDQREKKMLMKITNCE